MRKLITSLMAVAGLLGLAGGQVLAAGVSTSATANISSDSATGAGVTLPALTITETAAGDVPVGSFSLALPAGFIFDTGSVANVSATGTGLVASSTVAFPDAAHLTVTVTGSSTAAGTLVIGSSAPIKVKASSGSSLASGNITLSSGTINGITATTSFGTLTQIPGAPNKLMFTAQPPASVTSGAAFSAVIAVTDQFGNTVTNDSGRSITLTNGSASSTLGGTLTLNNSSGLAAFNNLTLTGSGSSQLTAGSSGLTGAVSNVVTIAAGTTTPPTRICSLRNGILVKVEGSPTIYMVVNCVLRPFNSAAIFHAKGKKFQDIVVISADQAAQLARGKSIGDGRDDDDTIIILPMPGAPGSGTSTLPNISGLPDGTVVKLPGNPTVYLVSGGKLMPFTSVVIFNLHGKKFTDVKVVTQEQFNQMVLGNAVTPPDGTLLKGSNQTVYVVRNGQLYGIPSMKVLQKKGLSLKKLLKLSDGEMKNMSHGGIESDDDDDDD